MFLNQKFRKDLSLNSQCKYKMKWFSGNSSTNDEGKFEYQEPKLLRVSRITENDQTNNLKSSIDKQNSDKNDIPGK